MRISLKILFVVALAIPTLATAVVAGSKHDLSNGGTTGQIKTTADVASCKFCHLVHNSATQGALWARSAPLTTAGYTPTSTINGTILPISQEPATQRCMSCHDGSVAMNQVVRKSPLSSLTLGTLTGTGVGATGLLTSASTAYLGAGLDGQHPVQIAYPTATASAWGYKAATETSCVSGTLCVTGAVGTGLSIKLFGTLAAPTVQCASCHEPHGVGVNPYFLRVTGAANYCTACHNK